MGSLKEFQEGHWRGLVGGHAITIARASRMWLVYIDHVLQCPARFASAEAAYRWVCSALRSSAPDPFGASGAFAPVNLPAYVKARSTVRFV
ncbi:MAG: hypothetical protein KDJ47_09300 [Hyphomicrobiaceae bacterium]|nr:hypothetical protein [Hyphomicrobiaceae bacterium]